MVITLFTSNKKQDNFMKKSNYPNSIFITQTSSFLPNNPIENDEIETYLGKIKGKPSRVRNIILRQNKIKTRYYAVDKNQHPTHSNAELAKNAIEKLFYGNNISFDLLSCGTSNADLINPSHASMVHGLLNTGSMEIYSLCGICLTSIQALKVAYLSLLSGSSRKAVCCASELPSMGLLSKHFEMEYEYLAKTEENPYIAFEKDFLRFMLADGAGAVLLEETPSSQGNSLKIEWIEMVSYANELPVCMYSGGNIQPDGKIKGWKEFEPEEIMKHSILMIKQNIKLLKDHGVTYWGKHIEDTLSKHNIHPDEIDFVIPHVSSMFFYDLLAEELQRRGISLTQDKWFTNLTTVGNIGSASIYVALDELFHSSKLKKGNKILLLVPESGRFSYGAVLLSVA